MEQRTFFRVPFKLLGHVEKCKAKLTNIKAVTIMIIIRVRRVIPRLGKVLAHLNFLHCLKLCSLLMGQQRSMVHAFVLCVFVVFFLLSLASFLFGMILLYNFFVCLFYLVVRHPFIISTI
jgi:hypothetical protein